MAQLAAKLAPRSEIRVILFRALTQARLSEPALPSLKSRRRVQVPNGLCISASALPIQAYIVDAHNIQSIYGACRLWFAGVPVRIATFHSIYENSERRGRTFASIASSLPLHALCNGGHFRLSRNRRVHRQGVACRFAAHRDRQWCRPFAPSGIRCVPFCRPMSLLEFGRIGGWRPSRDRLSAVRLFRLNADEVNWTATSSEMDPPEST